MAAYSLVASSPKESTLRISMAVRLANFVSTIYHYTIQSIITLDPSAVEVLRNTVGS